MIDYQYFIRAANLPKTTVPSERVVYLCNFFKVSDLRIMLQPDFLVNFRSGISSFEEKNIINAQAWLQTAMNLSKNIAVKDFNANKLRSYLPEIRKITLKSPKIFLPDLKKIFAECGVAFVLLPHLKNSGINSAVKWISSTHVLLAINDRRNYADTFWFTLFHEIKHVLQQKTKNVFINFDSEHLNQVSDALEKDADQFAQEFLIPPKEYKRFAPTYYTSDVQIVSFAKSIDIHPGIVAGRLQHDKVIAQNRCSKLKEKYKEPLNKSPHRRGEVIK